MVYLIIINEVYTPHHVSEILILSQGCSQKYKYNGHIHVDNNKIITLEGLLVNGITTINEV